jgi:glycosyltransferase involved in cell wall biosynthesis
MKIVHVFKDCYPPITGGIEQHINLLCRKLARNFAREVDVTVLAPSRSVHRMEEQREGVRIIRVPEFGRYMSVPLCPTAPIELHRLRPEIVHLHFPNPMGDITLFLSASKVPFVVTYHADIIKQKLFLPAYQPFMRLIFKKARRIIFSARENMSSFSLRSEHRDKCVVVPFGVDIEAFALRDREAIEADEMRLQLGGQIVLFVGAVRYYKGLDVLLNAMPKVHGRLIVAGRGTESEALKKIADDLAVNEKVVFCGEVSPSRLRILLNAADIFVLPSINRCETFGMAQLEAMACSKPVVSTDLPTGVQSVNRNGITGLVVPPGEPNALANALNHLLSNPGLRAEFGNAARRRIEREFNVDRMASKTLEIYREVLG